MKVFISWYDPKSNAAARVLTIDYWMPFVINEVRSLITADSPSSRVSAGDSRRSVNRCLRVGLCQHWRMPDTFSARLRWRAEPDELLWDALDDLIAVVTKLMAESPSLWHGWDEYLGNSVDNVGVWRDSPEKIRRVFQEHGQKPHYVSGFVRASSVVDRGMDVTVTWGVPHSNVEMEIHAPTRDELLARDSSVTRLARELGIRGVADLVPKAKHEQSTRIPDEPRPKTVQPKSADETPQTTKPKTTLRILTKEEVEAMEKEAAKRAWRELPWHKRHPVQWPIYLTVGGAIIAGVVVAVIVKALSLN
jgi:hypothetical protein